MSLTMAEFQTTLEQNIKSALPEDYAKAEVWTEKVLKEGDQEWTAIIVRNPGEEGYPRQYIDDDYQDYLRGKPVEDIIEELAAKRLALEETSRQVQQAKEQMKDLEWDKEHISCRLVNRENNVKGLENRPFTPVEDMAFIYSVELGREMRSPVTNVMLEKLEMSTEELHVLAMENTPTLLPLSIQFTPALMADPMDHAGTGIASFHWPLSSLRFPRAGGKKELLL